MNEEFEGYVDDPAIYRQNVTDSQYLSRVLKPIPRVVFDPTNSKHRQSFAEFQRNGRWTMMFYAEWPHVTVPGTVLNKIAEWACKKEFSRVKKLVR
jgi:hypothetical protein